MSTPDTPTERTRWRLWLLAPLLLSVLASCTIGVPDMEVTPTIAPTGTPDRTEIAEEATQTATALPTRTLPATATPTATNTPTATDTFTPTATDTPPNTSTPAPSQTPPDTLTPSPTNTPADTITPSPTGTFTATATPTETPTTTATPTATDTITPTFEPLPTRTPSPTVIPSTPPPTVFFIPTSTSAPTLAATPTVITAEPLTQTPDVAPSVVPIQPETPQPDGNPTLPPPTAFVPSPTPQPTVDLANVVIPPTVGGVQPPTPLPAPEQSLGQGGAPAVRSFDFAPSGEILPDEQTNTGNVAPQLFAANPTNPEEYAVVNPTGQLYFGAGGNNEPILTEPFTEYTYQVQNRAENNAVVTEITYSPTGKLAFVIAGNSINIDGVWIVQTIQGFRLPVQVLRDCPREGHPGCATVLGEGRTANYWVTERVKWNPADEQQLLAELYLPEEGRGGFVILTTELPDVERLPPVFRYESATWAADGAQIIASGASPTGQQVITAIDPNTGAEQLLLNASSIGLYTQSATRLSDGRVVAFASNAPNGIVRLVDVNGNALSGGVGVTPPERITWNAARTTALVRTTDGRAFLVNAGGSVSDASSGAPVGQPASSAGNPQPAANDGIPSGVVAGTAYDAGQQLRVLNPLLNIRQQPDVNSPLAGGLQRGDYVVVLAGPVEDDIYTWWRVQAANGQQGWVAGIIDGTATIGVP